MKYFKLFLMWLSFIMIVTLFGDLVISQNVNGFLQLIGFVGVVGLLMVIGNETVKILIKNKNTEK